jgi:hypothetical protein
MHYHCEIVIPPTTDIEAAVTSVMKQFDENDEENRRAAFWDWWVIGGRWAGHKLLAQYDQAKLDEFHEWLQAEKVTVSGLQCGKQELKPATQEAKVDAKWNEMFPSAEFLPCPLFAHSNDSYGKGLSGTLPNDVSRLGDVPPTLKCSRVIFAKPGYASDTKDWTGPLEAEFMLCESQWNGCNHMKVDWDETFGSALEQYREQLKNRSDEYAAKVNPASDWLVVTVDYHS